MWSKNLLLHNLAVIITVSSLEIIAVHIYKQYTKTQPRQPFLTVANQHPQKNKTSFLLCNPKHLLCLCQQATPDWKLSAVSSTTIAGFNTPPIGNIQRLLTKKTFLFTQIRMSSWGTDGRSESKSENSDSLLHCSNTAVRWSIGTNK